MEKLFGLKGRIYYSSKERPQPGIALSKDN